MKTTLLDDLYCHFFLFILQNNLGILYLKEEIETAQAYLESSEALYNQYMKEVCCMSDKFESLIETSKELMVRIPHS